MLSACADKHVDKKTGEIKDSWEEIIENIHNGKAQKIYKPGDWKTVITNAYSTSIPSQSIPMQLARFDYDVQSSGALCPTTWVNMKGWRWDGRFFMDQSLSAKIRDTYFPSPIRENLLLFKKDYYEGRKLKTETIYIGNLSESDVTTRYASIFPDQASRIRKSAIDDSTVSYILKDKPTDGGHKYIDHNGAIRGCAYFTQIDNESSVFCFCI